MVSPKLGKPSIGRAGGAVGLQAGLKRIKGPNLWVLYGSPMAGAEGRRDGALVFPMGLNLVSLQGDSAGILLAISFGPLGK